MKKILIALIFMVSIAVFGQEFKFDYQKDYKNILNQTKDSTSYLHYEKLLTRFQNNDTTLTDFEVLALLIGFTDNEHFNPYSYISIERKIFSLNGSGQFKEAIMLCDSFLVYVPLSQQALIEKSYSFYKLEQADSAQHYSWQFRRIMDAMGQSGDGLTPETAFFSLGPADGQNFIRKYLSGSIGTMGSGKDENGNFVDILELVWDDEETGEKNKRSLYFQIEHAVKTMFRGLDLEKLMKDADKKKKKNKKD